ncbi:MAG: twin-arginine translocase TatA/TatE family subunit [Anaerolineales bacterium]
MFGIGTGEVLLILIIATLVIGPEQMVSFARDMGQLLAKFRQETDSVTEEFREALSMEPGVEEAREPLEAGEGGGAAKVATTEESISEEEGKATEGGETEAQEQPVNIQQAFVDGERESFSLEEDEDAEDKPVLIIVGEPVPKDEDVEPIVIEEPVLIMDEDGEDTGEEEG